MALIKYATKEITAKIVYYGPGLSGKTTNLQQINEKRPGGKTGELLSLATEGDRTLFFDLLPMNVGKIAGFRLRFQLFTVPGQIFYNKTRKMVLRDADGVALVADSQEAMRDRNVESLQNLKDNLRENGLDYDTIPFVLQFNKRDLPGVMSVEEMSADLNERNVDCFEAAAVNGEGVVETLQALMKLVLFDLDRKYNIYKPRPEDNVASKAGVPAAPAPGQAAPSVGPDDEHWSGAEDEAGDAGEEAPAMIGGDDEPAPVEAPRPSTLLPEPELPEPPAPDPGAGAGEAPSTLLPEPSLPGETLPGEPLPEPVQATSPLPEPPLPEPPLPEPPLPEPTLPEPPPAVADAATAPDTELEPAAPAASTAGAVGTAEMSAFLEEFRAALIEQKVELDKMKRDLLQAIYDIREESDMMSAREVARYLHVSVSSIYQLANERKIPCTKLEGRRKWIFPKALVDDWIIEQAKKDG